MPFDMFAVCHEGFEDMALAEIAELIKSKGKAGRSIVSFSVKSKEDILKLIYLSQTLRKVCVSLASFSIKKDPIKELGDAIKKIDLSSYIEKDSAFRVYCRRIGEHDISSHDFAEEAGGFVIENVKKNLGFEPKVDLEKAGVMIYLYVHGKDISIGLDLCPLDLAKRPYKIFSTANSLKGSIASSLLRLTGFSKGKTVVDPFCNDGVIPIEAGLMVNSRSSHRFTKDGLELDRISFFRDIDVGEVLNGLDDIGTATKVKAFGYAPQLHHLTNAKKNAKIADVHKLIELSKVDVEWLDTKFDKGKVDMIVTRPPEASQRVKEQDVSKIIKELFYQSDYVLKKGGRLGLLSNSLGLMGKWADHYDFKKIEERKVWQGKMELHALVYEKKA